MAIILSTIVEEEKLWEEGEEITIVVVGEEVFPVIDLDQVFHQGMDRGAFLVPHQDPVSPKMGRQEELLEFPFHDEYITFITIGQ